MKRIYIIAGVLLSALIGLSSCDPADKFNNPERVETGSVPQLFTGMLHNNRFATQYYNVRTMAAEHTARFTQTLLLPNGSTQYRQNDGYVGNYWKDFYTTESGGPMGNYHLMEVVNKNLSITDQAANVIFFNAAKVVLYDYSSKMIDMFGDIPFDETGSLPLRNEITPPRFDNQKELYTRMINDLDGIAAYLDTVKGTPSFTKQDIWMQGDVKRWQRYANSLRLRLLIHMSYSDEDYARERILAMLDSPAKYPLIDGDNNPNYAPRSSDVINVALNITNLPDGSDLGLEGALREGLSSVAPDFMVNNLMVPTGDLRLPVMFDKNVDITDPKKPIPNTEYRGMPINTPGDEQSAIRTQYACWDSTTIWMNNKIPGFIFTATEVNLIKAEAQQRWGDPDKAKNAYETAVKQSISFYYYLNESAQNTSGPGFRIEKMPSDAEITKFVTERIPYTGTTEQRLDLIGTQKWLHLNFLQSFECWTELRRTKSPKKLLPFPTAGINPQYPAPPTRLLYPSRETGYNPHYKDVQANDTRTTKIFWDVK